MDNGHILALTGAELDAALARTQNISNPNLLDNWCFVNPVDQRGGYIVPSGTGYYDTPDGTVIGLTTVAYTVTKYNDYWGSFLIGGTTYYVPWTYCIRGYTGGSYSIDRWKTSSTSTVTVEADGILLANTKSNTGIVQLYENPQSLAGKTITFSVLHDGGLSVQTITLPATTPTSNLSSNGVAVGSLFARVYWTTANVLGFDIMSASYSGVTRKVYAVKLELGTQQTLAHKENGVWVLNEIPNYTEELAKCQRYYQVYDNYIWMIPCKDNVWRLNHAFPVAMRVAPAVVSHEAISDKEATVTFDSVTANGVSAFGTGDGQYVAVSNIVFDANL